MASLRELFELTINGELGKLLVKKFGGERGHTYPRKDSKFLIFYPEGTEPPLTEPILQAIKKYFEDLGYVLTGITDNGRDLLGFNVIPADGEECEGLIVSITTRFPHDGHKRWVAVETLDNF